MQKDFHKLYLDDYALPGFVSSVTAYYGNASELDYFFNSLKAYSRTDDSFAETLDAYRSFLNGNDGATHTIDYNRHKLIDTVTVIGEKSYLFSKEIKWTHKNIYGFPYYMKADGCENNYMWVKDGERYIRCVKAKFKNLSYLEDCNKDYFPIDVLWGHPCIIYIENNRKNFYVGSTLYHFDKAFLSKEDAKEDICSFRGIGNYEAFCNDIFADG